MICTFCGADSMEIRWDKKNRPYLACNLCSVKCFVRGIERVSTYCAVAEMLRSVNWTEVRHAAHLRLEQLIQQRRIGEKTNELARETTRAGS